MDLSPLGVRAAAGTLRATEGIVLHHAWTDEGVVAAPATNGAQVLHLSVALCILNDTYREAGRLGLDVDEVDEIPRGLPCRRAGLEARLTSALRTSQPILVNRPGRMPSSVWTEKNCTVASAELKDSSRVHMNRPVVVSPGLVAVQSS